MRRLCLLSAAALPLALSLSAPAADWPRFRGPNGTGVGDGPLPPVDPKAPLWKTPIPGKGVGSPIVVKGKVLLQGATPDGAKRFLTCLDAATGKELWTTDLPGKPFAKSKDKDGGGLHAKNTLASSTPASDGEMVYCLWWDGTVVSLRGYTLDGKETWAKPLGGWKSEHGFGHSPVVYGDKVFVNLDTDGAAAVHAFDKKTGEKVWSADRAAVRASYTPPLLLERPGKPAELVVASTSGVDSYSPDSGSVLWHYTIEWPTAKKLRMIGTPVFAGGLLVCYTGEGGNERYVVAIKPEGSGNLPATARAWEAKSLKKEGPYVPCMLAKGDHLYWADDGGFAGCTDAKTGKVLWYERVLGDGVTASPLLAGDQILILSEKGDAAVLRADKEFGLPDKLKLDEGVYASPAMADGRLFVRTTGHVICFGKK